jgi:hypothetical protein
MLEAKVDGELIQAGQDAIGTYLSGTTEAPATLCSRLS